MHVVGRVAPGAALLAALAAVAVAPSPAGAAHRHPHRHSHPRTQVNLFVHASTTLKKLNQTVVVPAGTFRGTLDPLSGGLTGNLSLPPASTTVSLAGIGLARVTFALVPTQKVEGTLNFTQSTLTAVSVFNVDITSVDPNGTSTNLVGNQCATSTPVSLTFSGTVALLGSSHVTGTYTIPNLANCQLLTPALNLVVPGSGNTFAAALNPFS